MQSCGSDPEEVYERRRRRRGGGVEVGAAALYCPRALERSRGAASVAVQDDELVVWLVVVAADADADALDPAAARNGQQERRRRLPGPTAAAGRVVRRRRPGEAPVGVRRRAAAGPCMLMDQIIKTHRLFAARVRMTLRTAC